ncbi:MAG: aldolase/citrate lyase family protein [Anaerolineales bacterium]
MAVNKLRQRIQSKQTSYGLWVTMDSPVVTEIAVTLGLDWVCIDMEHGHLDYGQVIGHLRALRNSGTSAVVRVPDTNVSTIKRALDMGAHGVILPLMRTAEDVELGFRYGRYPPRGIRGVGGERAVTWGLGLAEYLSDADQETLIIPLIETREAVDNIDSILAVPGLEAIFFGPADLSASQGHLGQWEGGPVAQQILSVREKAAARGIGAGVMTTDLADGARRRDQGFAMIGLGSDAALLIRSVNAALLELRGHTVKHLWS